MLRDAVVGVAPGVEFQIVEGGISWIEADYDWFTNGQFACGEVASFWVGGEILVPSSGETMAIVVVKVVGKGCAVVVAACASGVPLPFNVETADGALGVGRG